MANDDDVRPPAIEIPWRLASTTLPFNTTGPDQTSISLFTFVPDDENLTATFPDETLVFIKVTTSIAPGALPSSVPGGALGEGAAIAIAMVPFLLACIMFSFFGLQRRKWQQGARD